MTTKLQVIIRGAGEGLRLIDIADNQQDFESTTIAHLRGLIHKQWLRVSTTPDDLRIIHADKELRDRQPQGTESTLGDYDIHSNATLQLVFRLHGG